MQLDVDHPLLEPVLESPRRAREGGWWPFATPFFIIVGLWLFEYTTQEAAYESARSALLPCASSVNESSCLYSDLESVPSGQYRRFCAWCSPDSHSLLTSLCLDRTNCNNNDTYQDCFGVLTVDARVCNKRSDLLDFGCSGCVRPAAVSLFSQYVLTKQQSLSSCNILQRAANCQSLQRC
jgi:hypothetical protein